MDMHTVVVIGGGILALLALIVILSIVPIGLWITAKTAGAGISMLQLVAMRLRKVPPAVIVRARINALKAGLSEISVDQIEAHFLAGGHVDLVISASSRRRRRASTCPSAARPPSTWPAGTSSRRCR